MPGTELSAAELHIHNLTGEVEQLRAEIDRLCQQNAHQQRLVQQAVDCLPALERLITDDWRHSPDPGDRIAYFDLLELRRSLRWADPT